VGAARQETIATRVDDVTMPTDDAYHVAST
jgi:hypothetical protein